MYHRVGDLRCDPWRLAVHPLRFAEQLDVLTRHRAVVPLGWLVAELEAGRLPQNVACLTFDDGYVDVLSNAKPVLERFNAPATIFLTTGAIGRQREFWWDTLSRILLETERLPDELIIEVAGRRHEWRIDTGVGASMGRTALHLEVWNTLRLLPDSARDDTLAALAQWARRAPPARPDGRALDGDEVITVFEPGFIDIGAHGVTHASLPALSDEQKRAEIRESRTTCGALVGQPIAAFAYPFGDYDGSTEQIVRECGFSYACSTEPRSATSILERFRLPRLAMENWNAESLESRLHAGAAAFLGGGP
jgi:peptidoglycan/xylan/chitin deacetylase (PgdA/CDA1 family)